MIEKILERLEAEADKSYNAYTVGFISDDRAEYDAYTHAIEIVQEVAKEYDWIPVTERLPEPFQRVLVYDAWDDSMTIEHLQENDSFIDSVVAWMPLPIAPYQKGE